MVQGLVSILMPVFNGSAFLDRSIKSVLRQTYGNWELIIVDDKSRDESVNVVKKYLTDERIILLENEKNVGIAASRNRAIAASTGEFIAILDQDDEWKNQKLEKQINLFKELNSDYGLVYCNTEIHHSTGEVYVRKKEIEPGITIEENVRKLFLQNLLSSLTVMMKKECIKEVGAFDESIKWGGDDYDLWMRIAAKYKFAFLDESLAIRHEHGKNFSNEKKKMVEKSIAFGREYVERNPEFKPLLKHRESLHFYRYGIEQLKSQNYKESIIYISKAILKSTSVLTSIKKTISNRFKS
ncbi:MAG: glycosyltransferase [Balneolaceae bacterium]